MHVLMTTQSLVAFVWIVRLFPVEVVTETGNCSATQRVNETTCNLRPCVNGVCKTDDYGGYLMEWCECNDGWVGPNCDKCCDLPCEHGGICKLGHAGEKMCYCDYTMHTGDLCEVPEVNECNSPMRGNWSVCDTTWCKNGYCEKHWTHPNGTQYELCHCDKGWRGDQCAVCCDLPCENRGVCTLDNKDEKICDCFETGYHGDLCEVPYDNEGIVTTMPSLISESSQSTHFHTTITSAPSKAGFSSLKVGAILLAVLLVTCLVIVVVVIKKRRSSFTKHISRFSKWEEDDSHKYDVMLLFSCDDEASCHLVTRELVPALEDLGLNVCSNQPLILPHNAAEESISKASADSKRIILLLSQQFVQNNDTADPGVAENTDMLEVLDVDRTIAIVLGTLDVEGCYLMGLPVAYILEAVVCLNYPHNQPSGKAFKHFWRKLKLCLPRTKTDVSVRYFTV